MLQTLQIGMTASRRHVSGTDRYFLSLLRALPAHGVGVSGVVLGEPEALDDPVAGVGSFAPEGATRWRRWSGLRQAVGTRVRDAQLVVSHGAPHAFPALDTIARRPLVVHFHGPWALEGRADGIGPVRYAARRMQERAVYARARRFIVLSHAFAEILVREYGVDPRRVRIIPGGTDVERFAPARPVAAARVELGLPPHRPTIVTARRLVPTKGLDVVIEAMRTVVRDVPDAVLAIAGTGPLAGALDAQIVAHGLQRNVFLLGHLSDEQLPLFYRAGDVSIVPTQAFEGFGLVVPESLAAGTPALVTPVGGLPEVVRDLDRALVLDDASAGAMARGLTGALTGRRWLPSSGACIAYAQRFAWNTIAGQVRDVYREVA